MPKLRGSGLMHGDGMAGFAKIDSLDLAKYVLCKVRNVKHLKLQKLLYYIEAWHVAVFDKSIIDDRFEAWLHGPVSRKVWDEYKPESKLYDVIPVEQNKCAHAIKKVEDTLDEDQLALINDVFTEYGSKSAYHLEVLTHSEQPWIAARKGVTDGAASRAEISRSSMKKYYGAMLTRGQSR
jgi:uncharacterized phage-associated protein